MVIFIFYKVLINKSLDFFSFVVVFVFSTLVFILPQFAIIYDKLNDHLLTPITVQITLCILCTIIGCNIKLSLGNSKWQNPLEKMFHEEYLSLYSIVFLFISSYGFVKLLGSESALGTQWSGKDVMYNFFYTTYRYALVCSSVGYFKTKKKCFLFLLLLSSLFMLDRILIGGRRTDFVYFAIAIGIPYFYYTKAKIKIMLLIPAVIIAFQALTFMVALRSVTINGKGFGSALSGVSLPKIEEILSANEKLKKKDNRAAELNACCYSMEAVDRYSAYNYGAIYWNSIIKDFVPASVVGNEVKDNIMLPTKKYKLEGYAIFTGSTTTGFFDTYSAFGYFGCLFFMFMAMFMNSIYKRATNNNTFYMIFYLCTIVDSLHAVTHRSSLFISGILTFVIWLTIIHFVIKFIQLFSNSHKTNIQTS